ncbi:hypothetical protein [Streptomyces sp. MP131-18]|uniref:hypothetical protein n=1 Tax=Streptomyces sp. MP131-18 TaxID=1857892 RepID=UPI0009CC7626|nr:hypothetical protein [Streptomyces sp. MP131-18]ONK10539.1 hypothetical protein STBA_12610 [Streptomyces sp. MP131-18]
MRELPRDESLVRGAMVRAMDGLAPPAGLVHGAIELARRRRKRARAAGLGAGLCVAAAAATAALALTAGPGGAAGPPATPPAAPPAPSAVPSASRTPDSADFASRWDEDHRWQIAVTLRELLAPAVADVTPVEGEDFRYDGEGQGGEVFPITFSVRPAGDGPEASPCERADSDLGACASHMLADGTPVAVYTGQSDGLSRIAALLRFGGEELLVEVRPDAGSRTSAPVTTAHLLDVVADPRIRPLATLPDGG